MLIQRELQATFRFNAFTEDGLRSVNFINGVFFNIAYPLRWMDLSQAYRRLELYSNKF